ncbi:NlpC/P60 family protein [Streptomyces sp. NPDC048290]|uniref:C40 family peptidase n=1 Tax=Streptomyces sp. NPDC048290 TaxID=3155811 RepID=UPI0034160143
MTVHGGNCQEPGRGALRRGRLVASLVLLASCAGATNAVGAPADNRPSAPPRAPAAHPGPLSSLPELSLNTWVLTERRAERSAVVALRSAVRAEAATAAATAFERAAEDKKRAQAEAARKAREKARQKAREEARQRAAARGTRAQQAVRTALAQVGKPYVWGATGPSAFDCSGLMQYAYRRAGVAIPRVTWDQLRAGRRVSLSQLRPGDLVFYRNTGHVAMYIGNGKVVHSPRPGRTVRVEGLRMMPPEAAVRF